jgi:hypothetical protein
MSSLHRTAAEGVGIGLLSTNASNLSQRETGVVVATRPVLRNAIEGTKNPEGLGGAGRVETAMMRKGANGGRKAPGQPKVSGDEPFSANRRKR